MSFSFPKVEQACHVIGMIHRFESCSFSFISSSLNEASQNHGLSEIRCHDGSAVEDKRAFDVDLFSGFLAIHHCCLNSTCTQ